jgi:hypothetical protein
MNAERRVGTLELLEEIRRTREELHARLNENDKHHEILFTVLRLDPKNRESIEAAVIRRRRIQDIAIVAQSAWWLMVGAGIAMAVENLSDYYSWFKKALTQVVL